MGRPEPIDEELLALRHQKRAAENRSRAVAIALKSGNFLDLLHEEVFRHGDNCIRSSKILCVVLYYLRDHGAVPAALQQTLDAACVQGKINIDALVNDFNAEMLAAKRAELERKARAEVDEELRRKLASFDSSSDARSGEGAEGTKR